MTRSRPLCPRRSSRKSLRRPSRWRRLRPSSRWRPRRRRRRPQRSRASPPARRASSDEPCCLRERASTRVSLHNGPRHRMVGRCHRCGHKFCAPNKLCLPPQSPRTAFHHDRGADVAWCPSGPRPVWRRPDPTRHLGRHRGAVSPACPLARRHLELGVARAGLVLDGCGLRLRLRLRLGLRPAARPQPRPRPDRVQVVREGAPRSLSRFDLGLSFLPRGAVRRLSLALLSLSRLVAPRYCCDRSRGRVVRP